MISWEKKKSFHKLVRNKRNKPAKKSSKKMTITNDEI